MCNVISYRYASQASMRVHFTSFRMAENRNANNKVEDVGKSEISATAYGNGKLYTCFRKQPGNFSKAETWHCCVIQSFHSWCKPKQNGHMKIGSQMFVTTLFITAQKQRQHRCSSASKWVLWLGYKKRVGSTDMCCNMGHTVETWCPRKSGCRVCGSTCI